MHKLTYFNVMGLGEPIRLLLNYGGIKFIDHRIINREVEWKQLKPKTPFGHVPILEMDGKIHSQTLPICRYLAKKLELYGKNDMEELHIDSVAQALHDFRKQVALFYLEKDPSIKVQRKKATLTDYVPFYLQKLEAIAKENKGHFNKGELSYADFFFAGIELSMSNACEFDLTKDNPNLRSIREKIFEIPQIKSYIETRPKLEF